MIGIINLKALLIHRFFSPDSPPYAVILKNMAKVFQGMGYSVDVLSSQPSYKPRDFRKHERYKTVISEKYKIFRIPVLKMKINKINKLINYFWFPFAVFFWLLFRGKYTVVTVSTAPPVILSFFVAIVCQLRNSKLIYHCMDIHPEIGRISGEFRNKYIFKLLLWMDNYTCKSAFRVIVLSNDMKKSLVLRGIDLVVGKIDVINNFELPSSKHEKVNKSLLKDPGMYRIVFTGNIGRYQDLDSFILALVGNDRIDNFELVFVGEGEVKKRLEIMAKSLRGIVRFLPHHPIDIAKAIIEDADMAIVSLSEGVIDYAYPSKTMTYLSQGTPILLSVEEKSEISKFVLDNDIGVRVEPSNLREIYKVYKELSSSSYRYPKGRVKGIYFKNFAVENFNSKLVTIIENIDYF